ncbi:hypothetical protein CLV24_1195 [Pontibacter ummariensis]|uniref:Antitoxin VbhA domain-containing protein n=1 Tax=Pontibacter ummariensis TaxID=1610492 RepID=A0A239ITX7_9BACT|nr:hypothetical protein [Pontibacter ummariensis]PRY08955.1 hypothetical protein CLV24_1195 [Pontibacter ummariensis]SNS96985.1 hypothetical protein SAMN06296052_1195 [Pontibacter ummariensis]
MIRLEATLKDGTIITIENFQVTNADDLYVKQAFEAVNRQGYETVLEYLNGLQKNLERLRQADRVHLVKGLLEDYRKRGRVVPMEEEMGRSRQVQQANHIAACEGWEPTEFTAELDKLYVQGKITAEEQLELFNLMYL